MIFGRTGRRGSGGQAPPEAQAATPPAKPDATEGFPRGLPDGDRNKPSAMARWPSTDEIAAMLPEWRPGMFLLGRDNQGRYYGHADDRHVLTVAGSRAGKGVSLIVPNLIHWPGSVIAIDPKGELASLTASRRSAMGSSWSVPMTPGQGKVFALDPFERVTGEARQFAHAAFNPMAGLDAGTGAGQDLAYQLADSLIIQAQGDGAHWTQSGRELLRLLILYVAATKDPDSKNLITVRRLLTQSTDNLKALGALMAESPQLQAEQFETIARGGAAMAGMRDGELGSIRSGIEAQTAFLEGPEMKRTLSGSSFRLEDLKGDERVTVYLCLPATRLATHGRWLRMIVTLAMDAMERTGPLRKDQPAVLFCLDEFAALGTMETVEKAAGQIASFGVKLWPIIQDITQLKRDYNESWETFMGNAGLLTFFGNTDLTTTQHIAERLGETEVLRALMNASQNWTQTESDTRPDPFGALLGGNTGRSTSGGLNRGGGQTLSQQVLQTPLLRASEVVMSFARETGKILVMIPDKAPCALYRCAHHSIEDKALFDGFYDEVPGQNPPRMNRTQREEQDRSGGLQP